MNWFIKCLKNYATFNGRARRTEYWMFYLFSSLSLFLMSFIFIFIGVLGAPVVILSVILGCLYFLFLFLPALSVTVRRLHDTNKRGAWILISFVPFGSMVLFVFMLLEGNRCENQYGPDPKAIESEIANA